MRKIKIKKRKYNFKREEGKLAKLNADIWALRDRHTRIMVPLIKYMRAHKIRKVGGHAKVESSRTEWNIEGMRALLGDLSVIRRAKKLNVGLTEVVRIEEFIQKDQVEELLKLGVLKKKQVEKITSVQEQTPYLRYTRPTHS